LCIEIGRTTGKLEFLVTNKNEIWRVQENGDRHQYSTNASAIGDVDYHLRKNILFWIDSGRQEIHSQPLDVNSILPGKTFKQRRNWEPVSLAIDFIGDKVYVVDIFGVKIDVFELDGRYHSIVLGVNLIRPIDIKLDPYERYMFILDGFRIIRLNIDGTAGVSIIAKGIRNIRGLFIDSTDKKIYWSRNRDSEVISSNYFGENITSSGIRSSSHIWSKFTVFNGNIFWPSNFIYYKSECCDKSFKMPHKTIYQCNPIATIKVLKSPIDYVMSNPCDKDNGNCQHMCITISKRNNESKYNHVCACNIGWILAENLKDCIYGEEFLMYAQSTIIKSHLIEHCNDTFCEPYLPIVQSGSTFTDFDYNIKDNYLYYIARNKINNDVIYKIHPNGSESKIFLSDERENYQSLTIDLMTTNLYYTNFLRGTINSVNTNNKVEIRVLIENLEQPEDIFYYKKGFLYFFQTNQSTKFTFFSRIRTDGSNLTIFNNVQLKKFCGFTIDSDENRIYWYERSKSYIEHSNVDLSDVQITRSTLTKSLYSISVHEKWIYFATTNSEGLWRVDKKTGKQSKLIFGDLGNRITKIKVFSAKTLREDKDYAYIIHNNKDEKLNFSINSN
jgi:low density lipoprotein-related protein 2